jgi:TolB-like protein/DNA-binding winged helix-turn-helix (wHTH) protein/Tfp pilus assembly protein PilF
VKVELPRRYDFQDFSVDLARGLLVRRNREIRLRPKAFATLQYLVENPNRLIGKDELIDAVWRDTAVTDNSLAQCLRDVRRALGRSSERCIRTVPRRGYIFELPGRPSGEPVMAPPRAQKSWREVTSLAVLPFWSAGSSPEDEFLGFGMADTLITKLSAIGGLVVRPTSAIQRYRSVRTDSRTAGREQKVDAVLEGTVQHVDDRVRVSVRLVDTRQGSTLWADTFDDRFADVFAVQDAISARTTAALSLKLTAEARRRLAKRLTDSPEAQELYARGLFLRNQMTPESLRRSIASFERAIEIDARYALAYAAAASSYSPLAYLGHLDTAEVERVNRALVSKALALDDGLAEVHAAAGEFKLFVEWDWQAAEREFKHALDINPHDPLSLLLYPDVLLILGRPEEAISVGRLALELDPLSPRTGKSLAWIYLYAQRYDDAIDQFTKTRELFPAHPLIDLGPCFEQKGRRDLAIREYLDTEARNGLTSDGLASLREAHAAGGWDRYWRMRIAMAEQRHAAEGTVPSVTLARYLARLGDTTRAIQCLKEALRRREMPLVLLEVDPDWKDLRPLLEFQTIARQMRFPGRHH